MKKSDTVVVSSAYLPKKKTLKKQFISSLPLLCMILPGFFALLIFHYKPIYGLLIAFQDYKPRMGVLGSPLADNYGMENFLKLFANYKFVPVLLNTVKLSFLHIICGFPAPIILALLLNEIRCGWFKKVTQTLTYMPTFFSWVIMGGIFKMIFSTVGPVNILIQTFGGSPVGFFTSSTAFVVLLITTHIWKSVGSGAIIYIAALAGVDESLYEAAYIDGASKFKQIIYITLPSIMGTITTVFIMNMSGILNAGFDQIFNMYNYSVYDVSDIIDTYSYTLLKRSEWELGTTIGLFKSGVGLIFVLSSNWFIKKISDDEFGIL